MSSTKNQAAPSPISVDRLVFIRERDFDGALPELIYTADTCARGQVFRQWHAYGHAGFRPDRNRRLHR